MSAIELENVRRTLHTSTGVFRRRRGVGLLAIDAAVGTLWALTGLALFSWIETQARRRGSLEGF